MSSDSVAMGLAFGITSVLWLGFIFNDTVIEISLTLAVSYLAFFTVRTLLSLCVILLLLRDTLLLIWVYYVAGRFFSLALIDKLLV